jgi:ribosomal protein L29
MTKHNIIFSTLVGAASLAMALSASAQTGAAGTNAGTGIVPGSTASARMHARLGRFASTTPPGARSGIGSTTRMQAEQQRITALQGKSDTEITNRIDSLNKLLARLNSMVNISASEKTSMSSSVQTEIADLTTLKTSIDSDTSSTTLKTDYQSITKSYRVYALVLPQASITAAADRVLNLVLNFNALAAKLQGYITTAQSSGTNVSSAVSAMSDITAKIADASTQANAAVSETAGLQPDQGATTTLEANTAALKDAQSKIKAATADLVAARKDVNTIVGVIKGSMKVGTNASTTASVSASTTTQ